jgi:hypothetical protein
VARAATIPLGIAGVVFIGVSRRAVVLVTLGASCGGLAALGFVRRAD